MQYLLTTLTSGALAIQSVPAFTPPLGLVLPKQQDVRVTLTEGRALSALITHSSPSLPTGLEVHAGFDRYVFNDGHWLNHVDESNADSAEISGVIHFRNPASYDIGITW